VADLLATQTVAAGKGVQPGLKTPCDTVANTPSGHVLDQALLVLTEKVIPEPLSTTDLSVALVAQPNPEPSVQSWQLPHTGLRPCLIQDFHSWQDLTV
jgi:hypothetical protein